MNQLTKELYKRAWMEERQQSNPNYKFNELSRTLFNDNKEMFDIFTRLIVLACADSLSGQGEFNSAENIKTLFGVE